MFELKAKEILEAVKGSLITGDENLSVKGVSTDSRTIKQGEIFFALIGPNFDGNRFVEDVFKKGAGGAVVARCKMQDARLETCNLKIGTIISVDDTLIALGDLARYWRIKHPLPLIAVSGSCGKTTTKEMIASILNTSYCAVKTEGNLNNLIGMPLTLFGINNKHNAAVVELGISEKGEMARLASICKPNVAVLTNIGEAHLKTFKNIEGVACAKAELFSGLKSDGIAVINIDDQWIAKTSESVKQKKITFSIKSAADVFLKEYSKGKSLNQISEDCGVSIPTLAKKLRAMNIYVKSRKDRWNDTHVEIIKKITELQNGKIKRLTYKELAKQLDLHVQTVSKHMKVELERELSPDLSKGQTESS